MIFEKGGKARRETDTLMLDCKLFIETFQMYKQHKKSDYIKDNSQEEFEVK